MISRSNLFRAAAGVGFISATQSVGLAAPSNPVSFDRKEFERRMALDYRHRQVFAASHLDLGSVLHYIQNSLNAYADPDGFAEGPGTLHAAAVFYGASIATVLNDDMWNRFNLGPFFERFGERVPAQSGAVRKSPFADTATGLRAHGVSFFVCRNALHDIALALSAAPESGGQSKDDIYATLSQNLIADALLVPAGVAALNALQEAHFTLMQATCGAH